MLLQGRGTRRRPCDSRLERPTRSTSSLLGFYWRPLQSGMRPLQVWRATASVKESLHSNAWDTIRRYH